MERFGRTVLWVVLALMLFSAAFAEGGEEAKETEEAAIVNPVYSEEFVEMQQKKLEMVPKLFPRKAIENKKGRTGKKEEVTQFEGFKFTSRLNDQGQDEITITSDTVSPDVEYNRGWGFYKRTGAHSDFYVNLEVQFVSQAEDTEGWLWFQYSDLDLVGDENRHSVEFIFPRTIDRYRTVPSADPEKNERVYQTFYDLSSEYQYSNGKLVLEMIRLDGYTSCYINHKFVAGFEDGFDGAFYPLYGVGLSKGGKEATFAFNDLIMLAPPKSNQAYFTPDFSVSEH